MVENDIKKNSGVMLPLSLKKKSYPEKDYEKF